jgi:type II secretory pathway pseudopilin PulG
MRKNFGIGLLELMLALAIIAALLISAVRYFQNAQTGRQVQAVIATVEAVYAAGNQYVLDNNSFTTGDDIQKFIDRGLLPENFIPDSGGYSDNPWGGEIYAQRDDTSNSATSMQLKFTKVPAAACENLRAKLLAKFFVSSITDCQALGYKGDFIIKFKDYMSN